MLVLLVSLRVVFVPAATTAETDVLAVAGVLSATTLVLTGLTALLESLLLWASVLLLACLLLFFCLQLIVCLLLLFSLRKFVSVPGCSYTSSGLLLNATFCCRLYCCWLKNNTGKKPPDADHHTPFSTRGKAGRNHLNEEITPSSSLGQASDSAKPYQIYDMRRSM
jgi:hypothetical protein